MNNMQMVNCPKCGREYRLNEWLMIGAVHVLFDCDGVKIDATTRQTTLKEIETENEKLETQLQEGEEE
tara:strand:- start:37 stop:240 length:204 start_codon:yes stop_codon:yes gene_type:complete